MPMYKSRAKVNLPVLMRVTGWLLMIEAAFMLFPLLTCLIYGESDYMAFLIATAITATAGGAMTFLIKPTRNDMAKREGFLLTALVWVIFSLFGMIPFLLSSTHYSISDAFFEAMSGFTTTGVSALSSVEQLSHGLHLWRCLMQWIGGMGIILFTLAVIPMLNHSGGMQMFNAEVTGITRDKIRPRVSQTAKTLWFIYFLLSIALCLLLWAGPMDFFDSMCHALSSMSTGGFSTRDAGIAAWESNYLKIVLIVFMFIGGINFALIYKASVGDFKSFRENDSFKAYLKIIGLALIAYIAAITFSGQAVNWESVSIDPLFQIVSALSSTGYTTSAFENWGTTILLITFILMFFGACAGSTSGGAKIDRLIFMLKNLRNEVHRCIQPNAILSVRVNGRVIAPELVSKVMAFLWIYVLIIIAGGVILTSSGMSMPDAFYSAFSCVSNTGLTSAVTGNGNVYAFMPDAGKWLLSFLMLVGRLELFTVLVLFSRSFWRK